jgi:hypothetical protein
LTARIMFLGRSKDTDRLPSGAPQAAHGGSAAHWEQEGG